MSKYNFIENSLDKKKALFREKEMEINIFIYMVCNTCLGSLPNELRINKMGFTASKAALECVKPPPGTLSSQAG